ncbi:MAG TPA: hypothetical protein VGH74_14110, partial [Planctomycetaceae bacterium]
MHDDHATDLLPFVVRVLDETIDESAQKPASAELQHSFRQIVAGFCAGHHSPTSTTALMTPVSGRV